MEKDVAVREWCVERAITLGTMTGIPRVGEIISSAKSLEAYILDKEPEDKSATYTVLSDGSVAKYED